MKKAIGFLLAICAAFGVLVGCGDGKGGGNGDGGNTAAVQVYMPDGAPAISMAKMISDGYEGAEFTVVNPSDIGAMVVSGKADMAILPTNAAANLCSKAGISMVAVTNFGSLYLVGNGQAVNDLEGLKGKVVYSIGQGNVPDLVFRMLLKQAGIAYEFSDKAADGKVSLAYVGEGTEFIAGMTAGKMSYGVISEPAATVAQNKVEGASPMLDIQTIYKDVIGGEGFPQAALVVRNSFLENNREYVKNFVDAFRQGVKWAETNPAQALAAIKSAGSTAVPMLNEKVAKGCNLGFTWAATAKDELVDFYGRLKEVAEQGETPVGAALPADSFYLASI